MINVVCLKWGDKYTCEDVNKLAYMVSQSLSKDYQFYCITEDGNGLDESIQTLPLFDEELEGWWHKLTLFRKDFYGLTGTTLFLDLDVVITGSIDEIINYKPGQVVAAQDYGRCKWGEINSSVVRFEIGQLEYVWNGFLSNKQWVIENMHGDQDWLGRTAPQIAKIPSSWVVSYKKHCNSEAPNFLGVGHKLIRKGWVKPTGEAVIPEGVKIILFHGKPDPVDVVKGPYMRWKSAPWILNYWPKAD